MKGEGIIEATNCMSKLVDMALGQWIEAPSFDIDAKLFDYLDVDERPPPIVKLANAHHHTRLLATYFYEQPIRGYHCRRNGIAGHIGEAQ